MPRRVLHITDLEAHDRGAFAHAAWLAASLSAELIAVHTARPGAPSRPIHSLADQVKGWPAELRPVSYECIRYVGCDDPLASALEAMVELQPMCVVLGSSQKGTLQRLWRGSVSEAVVREAKAPVLVVPHESRPFVDAATGEALLRRVLVPLGDDAEADAATRAICHLVRESGVPTPYGVLLRFGALDESNAFADKAPPCPGIDWRGETHDGDVVDGILAFASARSPNLVVMATRGHDSMRDSLVGSTTERVLRDVGCPLLAVPV